MNPAFNRMWASSIVSNLADGVMLAAKVQSEANVNLFFTSRVTRFPKS
jgi:hypothetical protein